MQLQGKGVSSGIGIGPAAVWQVRRVEDDGRTLTPVEAEQEAQRLEAAAAEARTKLQELYADALERLGAETAGIMQAHLLMLDDPMLVSEALDRIRRDRKPAPVVMAAVSDEVAGMLAALDDPYLRERSADVRDVAGRLIRTMTGGGSVADLAVGAVLVAEDVPPSELVRLEPGHLAGLVLTAGGTTSHTAILARSMGIPAVMGAAGALEAIAAGTTVVMDGDNGTVLVDPPGEVQEGYRQRLAAQERERAELSALRNLPAQTADGHDVLLVANIGSATEARAAREAGARGVGLFRTEFLFLDRAEPPSEQEQYDQYKAALEAMAPYPVLFRTLDIGGDKPLPYLGVAVEENPFLGLRGIRLCQQYTGLFRTQVRALLRAGVHGKAQIMVPMVSAKEEIEWVRDEVAAARAELQAVGTPCAGDVELGIMVETPAAALMAEAWAPLVDFFSIGTNDLTQYTTAVDRMNPTVSGLYDPLHPAILRLVQLVADGAHKHGRWVGMCGELAGDPTATALLLGLGLDELSMSALRVGRVKQTVRSTDMESARRLAAEALAQGDAASVRRLLVR